MEIRELAVPELGNAGEVLGRGMRDNPLHVAAFGTDPAHREATMTRIFRKVLPQCHPKGAVLGALDEEKLVGVCAMVSPGRCQPGLKEKLQLLPAVFSGNSLRSGVTALRWIGAWSQQDPRQPHWHLGPVGVERELQGRGIGGALLTEFSRRMDQRGETAYLETDKDVNVPFYERFGFRIVAEADVIGVRNWFMIRPPQGDS